MKMLSESNPEEMREFREFMNSVIKPGRLDTRTKELIALGTSITARCMYCIDIHVRKALGAGATKEEILEAAMVSILMGGGPALTYVAEVKKAIDEFDNAVSE
ncbi:MAG: carboxymuconolactone decarboxylase family protein [Bacteroidota bacterium]